MIKSLYPCRYADIVFYTFNYLDKKCPCSKNLYFHENNNIHKMEADLPEKLYSLPKICKSTCTYVYISRDLYGHHNKDIIQKISQVLGSLEPDCSHCITNENV